MNYTPEQIEEAFNNLTPLTKKTMYYLNVNEKIREIINTFEIEDDIRESIYSIFQCILIGLMKYDDFENYLISKISLDRTLSHKISTKLKENILDEITKRIEIEDRIESNIRDLNQIENDEPPLPPYKKTEEVKEQEKVIPKNKEELFYEENGIEFVKEDNNNDEFTTNKDNSLTFEDSGIDVLEEKEIGEGEVLVPETEKIMMEGIEHPESISSGILGNKLKETYGPKITETDYTIPKINDNTNKSH